MPANPHTYASVDPPARFTEAECTPPNSGTRSAITLPHTGDEVAHSSAPYDAIQGAERRTRDARPAPRETHGPRWILATVALTIAFWLALLTPLFLADAFAKCRTKACWKRVHDTRAQRWLERHTVGRYSVHSTAYCPGSSGTTMADGRHVYFGAVANNFLALGTRIRTDRQAFGKRWFTVHDRIGYGSELDFWVPSCAMATDWGARSISFRVVRR